MDSTSSTMHSTSASSPGKGGSLRAAQEAAQQAIEEAKVWRDAQQEIVSMLEQQNEEYTNELWRAQRQRDTGGSNAIRAIAGVREANRKCNEIESKLTEARAELQEAEDAYNEATNAYHEYTREIETSSPQRQTHDEDQYVQKKRKEADRQVQREKRRAEATYFRGQSVAEEARQQHEEIAQTYDKKLDGSRKARQKARPRIQEEAARAKELSDFSKDFRQQEKQSRLKSIIELKDNTEEALRQMRSQNYIRKKKQEEKKKQQESRARQLRKQGQNPHEVFRKEQIDAQYNKQKRDIRNQIADSKLRLGAEVAEEEDQRRRKEESQRLMEERTMASKTTKTAQEEEASRLDEYMRSKTLHGENIVDAGGRSRKFNPSEVVKTERAPPKLGLGTLHKEQPERMNALAQKHGLSTVEDMQMETRTRLQETGTTKKMGTGKQISQRELSNLEKKMMRDARERQRQNISGPQVVMGKTFETAGFTSSPACIEFKDYDPDNLQPLVRTFTLTNTSLSFNSFKILPLPDSIRDLFEIEFKPPGRMSAGLSCKIKITFYPRIPQDINSFIDVRTSISQMSIPLRATYAKAKPVLKTPVVDIGDATRGSKQRQPLILANEGALAINYYTRVEGVDKHEEDASYFSLPASGKLAGYGEARVPVTFAAPGVEPEANTTDTPRDFATKAIVEFEPVNVGKDAEGLEDSIELLTKARSLPLPLFLLSHIRDAKTCMIGKPYRIEIPVFNRGSISYKTQIKLPSKLREMEVVGVSSTFGFVQQSPNKDIPRKENAGFIFSVGLTIPESAVEVVSEDSQSEGKGNTDYSRLTGKYSIRIKDERLSAYVDTQTNCLSIPFSLVSEDMPLPVEGSIQSTIAPGQLIVDPPELDFGHCRIGQDVSRQVLISNSSPIPVRFGVVAASEHFHVTPSSGFGALLPGEGRFYDIVFSPSTRETLTEKISFENTLNTACVCKCDGEGLKQQIQVSNNRIIMPALAVGEECSSVVTVTNIDDYPLNIKLLAPAPSTSQVSVYPTRMVALQPAHELAVDFHASIKEWYPKGTEEQEYSQHRRWLYGIAAQRVDAVDALDRMSKWRPHLSECVGVEVDVNVVEKSLEINPKRLDFGELAIGDEGDMTVNVRCVKAEGESNFALEGLSPTGPFAVVNAPRAISSGRSCNIRIFFRPEFARMYEETAYFRDSDSGARCRIQLRGEGKSPLLRMEPENGMLTFGNVSVGCVYSKQVKVTNSSYFSVPVQLICREMRWLSARDSESTCFEVPSNSDGSPLLEYSPAEAVIPPEGSQLFVFTLSSTSSVEDGERLRAQFLLKPQQETEFGESVSLPISVEATLWQKFVFAHSLQHETEDGKQRAGYGSSFCDRISMTTLSNSSQPGGSSRGPLQVSATPDDASDLVVPAIRLGCTELPDDVTLDKGAYEIVVPNEHANHVLVDPTKGDLKPGTTIDVYCKIRQGAKSLLSGAESGSLIRFESDGRFELLQYKMANCRLHFTGSAGTKGTNTNSLSQAFEGTVEEDLPLRIGFGIPHQPYA
eukprot:gb/GECG01009813.1/.p1 GENE.gb/GECG01009813.1/~~gb/GECG01009813.1/.p1  ORF type:complete len:1530 (+),score=241.01 gb/GECG01009813.1/:1-4590(+)